LQQLKLPNLITLHTAGTQRSCSAHLCWGPTTLPTKWCNVLTSSPWGKICMA